MGSYTSKLFSNHNEDEAKNKPQTNTICPSDLQKTKLCTPPITKRKLANDPRSATIGIVRTPIEVTCTPPALGRRVPNALPKYLQSKRYLETDFDSAMPMTPEKFVLDPRSPNIDHQRTPIMANPVDQYSSTVVTVNLTSDTGNPNNFRSAASAVDPRSPATDFDRTPILKPRFNSRSAAPSEEVVASPTHDENRSTKLSYCETTTDYSLPEIQTIAEPISQIDESSRSKNSPCVSETLRDLTLCTSSSGESSDCSETDQQITVIPNPTASSLYSAIASIQTENKTLEIDDDNVLKADETNDSLGEALDNEISEIVNTGIGKTNGRQKILTNNDKVKIWRDSISPSINDEVNIGENVTTGESVVESDVMTITKNPKTTSTVTAKGKIDDDASKNHMKKKKLQQQIKSGNKPLIEERENFNNEEKNPVDPSLNRTPLGNRSNNHKQRPRIAMKSPQQLLRNKGLSVQQENTPPTERFVSKTKPHGIQWDPDTTIII